MSIKKTEKTNGVVHSIIAISFLFALLCVLIMPHAISHAAGNPFDKGKTLVVYYSRSGKSRIVGEVIQKKLSADLLEIKDKKDRSGTWGFMVAAYDSMFDKDTEIEPANPDFSDYSTIFLVSPIWNWKLAVPMRTLLKNNRFNDKKLVVVTTANIDIKKYEQYGDDGPFIKRFLRDYLRKSSKQMRALAVNSGAEIVDHFHIETKGLSKEQLEHITLSGIYSRIQTKSFLASL